MMPAPMGPSKRTPDSKRLLEKATCGTCGYGWPWAEFTTRDQIGREQDDTICMKCIAPLKDRKRWLGIIAQANQSMKEARKTLENIKKKRPAIKASQGDPVIEDQSVLLPRKQSRSVRPVEAAPVPSLPPLPLPASVPVPASVAYPQPYPTQHRPPPPPLHLQQPHHQQQQPHHQQPQPHHQHQPQPQPQPQYAYPIPPAAPVSQGAYLAEPTRAFHWILANYYPNPSSSLEQMSVFNHYVDCFRAPSQHDPNVPRLLGGIDFLMLLPRAFPGCRLNGRGYLVEGIARLPTSQEPPPMPVRQMVYPPHQISTHPVQYPPPYPTSATQIYSHRPPNAYPLYPPSNTHQRPPPVHVAAPLPTPPLTGTMAVAGSSRKRPRKSETPIQVIDIASTDVSPTLSSSDIRSKQDQQAGGLTGSQPQPKAAPVLINLSQPRNAGPPAHVESDVPVVGVSLEGESQFKEASPGSEDEVQDVL